MKQAAEHIVATAQQGVDAVIADPQERKCAHDFLDQTLRHSLTVHRWSQHLEVLEQEFEQEIPHDLSGRYNKSEPDIFRGLSSPRVIDNNPETIPAFIKEARDLHRRQRHHQFHPEYLRGENVSRGRLIIGCVDVIHAMRERRGYKPPMEWREIRDEFQRKMSAATSDQGKVLYKLYLECCDKLEALERREDGC